MIGQPKRRSASQWRPAPFRPPSRNHRVLLAAAFALCLQGMARADGWIPDEPNEPCAVTQLTCPDGHPSLTLARLSFPTSMECRLSWRAAAPCLAKEALVLCVKADVAGELRLGPLRPGWPAAASLKASFAASEHWRVVSCTPGEAGDDCHGLSVAVVTEGPGEVVLTLPATPRPYDEISQLSRLADHLLASGSPDEVAPLAEAVARLRPGSLAAAELSLKRARAAAALGDAAAAAVAYASCLRQWSEPIEHWQPSVPSTAYLDCRAGADMGAEIVASIETYLGAQGTRGGPPAALDAAVADCEPHWPYSRRAPLRCARRLADSGETDLALGYCLRLVALPGDALSRRLVQPGGSQRELDAVAEPLTAGEAAEMLSLLGSPEAEAQEAAAAWAAADTAGRAGQWQECTAKLEEAASTVGSPPARSILELAQCRWHHLAGRFSRCADAARRIQAGAASGSLASQCAALWIAVCAKSCGNYELAMERAAEAALCADGGVRAGALWTRGECAECMGQASAAREAYTALRDDVSAPAWARHAAAHGLTRLQACRTPVRALRDGPWPAVYMGEDRQTQGDWSARYGATAFVLCGQQTPGDVRGGLRSSWPCEPARLTEDPPRLWASNHSDADPSFLCSPITHAGRPANWDDHGEGHLIADGPDLRVNVDVPVGDHVVSLYFVNDRNYYESSRRYTVYLCDRGSERVLAACGVEDFANGVYHRFAVSGPRKLSIHVHRNLSVNVLLSGAFLDPLQEPAYLGRAPAWAGAPRATAADRAADLVSRAQGPSAEDLRTIGAARARVRELVYGAPPVTLAVAWQHWRAWSWLGQEPAEEQLAFRAVCEALGADRPATEYLWRLGQEALAARRYATAEAAHEALVIVSRDRLSPLELTDLITRLIRLHSRRQAVLTPTRATVTLRTRFPQRLAADLAGTLLARYPPEQALADIRRIAGGLRRRQQPDLVLKLYEVAEATCPAQLTVEDHIAIAACDADKARAARRIQTVADRDLSADERLAVLRLLLRLYLASDRVEDAEDVVARIMALDPTADVAANTSHELAIYLMNHGREAEAAVLFRQVAAGYPDTPWAGFAAKYLEQLDKGAQPDASAR